ncbi:MAG: DUF5671 domain-containing protein [Patescibacteria group bacterium]
MNHTARSFVLQLGALISLYISLSFLLVLLFGIINLAFPDAAESYWAAESAHSSIRIGIAMLLVFFPTYIVLTRMVNQIRRVDTDGQYLTLTKWLIYLSLLIGGLVLLGDLVAVIMTFLEGEITERFLLKALAILVVVGAAFKYYILDAGGYWIDHVGQSVVYGLVAFAVVIVSVAYGFVVVDSPELVREKRVDQNQLQDLQEIQWRVIDYYAVNQSLPNSIDMVFESGVPTAPENRDQYSYTATEEGFELCASFSQASSPSDSWPSRPADKDEFFGSTNNWDHGIGYHCFVRPLLSSDVSG